MIKTLTVALLILILSVVVNFLLNISSFEDIFRTSLISKYQFMNKNLKNKIEVDLNYGKPLYMLTGIDKYFREIIRSDNNIANLFIASVTGKILYSYRGDYIGKHLIDDLLEDGGEDFSTIRISSNYYISSVIKGDSGILCSVFIEFSQRVINDRVLSMIGENLIILIICLVISGFVLTLLLIINHTLLRLRIKNIFIMILVLVITQVSYTLINTGNFEKNYLTIIDENINYFAGNIENEIRFFLKHGLSLKKLKNFDTYLARELAVVPECEQVFIAEESNIYYYADSHEKTMSILDKGTQENWPVTGISPKYQIAREITYKNQPVGKIVTGINKELIDARVRALFLDAATILIISLILSYQLLLFPYLKVRGSEKGSKIKKINNDILIRLLSFLFYFAEILPLSFIPLLIVSVLNTKHPGIYNVPENIIISIPIACYLLGTAISVLVVGNISESVSKRKVFSLCALLLICGAIGAALVKNIRLLTFFRLISGIGYGGISINSTSLILSKYDETKRATGFGFWASGYGAASICAISIGGVVVFRFGFTAALFLSALIALLLMIFSLHYLKPEHQGTKEKTKRIKKKRMTIVDILNIFTDKNVTANFFFRLVPFHLVYVGIFQFALPLLMNQEGVSQADIGRVLSVFGLLYIGMPIVSKWVDKLRNDKIFIFLGTLIIGGTLLFIKIGSGVWWFIFLVSGISLGSMIADAAEESFITSTKKAVQIGKTRLMTIYTSYERFLMVISPLICSLLITVFKYETSIFIIGVFTIVCALLYFVVARSPRARSAHAR